MSNSDLMKRMTKFIRSVLDDNGAWLEWAPDELRDDEQTVLLALRSGASWKFVSDRLKNDREFVLKHLTTSWRGFLSIDKIYRDDH